MQETDHLWVEDGDRIVCTHCDLDLKDYIRRTNGRSATISRACPKALA